MAQPSVWYDTCPVCEGRGAIPCKECSGSGYVHDSNHSQLGAWIRYGETSGQEEHEAASTEQTSCPECVGKGAVRCTVCPGNGMRGLPAFSGTYF